MIYNFGSAITVNIVSIALIASAVVYVLLGLYTARQKARGASASYLTYLLLAMAWWSATYGLEIHVPHLPAKLFWASVEYPAIVAVPVLWLAFVMNYVGRPELVTGRNRVLAWMLPVFIVIAVWTNEFHRLYYIHTRVEITDGLALLVAERGPIFWLNIGYAYLLLGAGSILLFLHTLRSPYLYRVQTFLVLAATIAPWAGNLIYILGIIPIRGLDVTPFAFIPTSIAMTWAIARYHLLDITPPTQHAILQDLRDGVLLADPSHRVLYMNRSAGQILSHKLDLAIGQQIEDVCKNCIPPITPLAANIERHFETALQVGDETRHFDMLISPHYVNKQEQRSEAPSHIIIFHDVTQQRQTQAALKHREAILHAVNIASELFLKTAGWERHIPSVLEQLCRAAAASQVHIFEQHVAANGRDLLVSRRYEWMAEGLEQQLNPLRLQNLPWGEQDAKHWFDLLRKGLPIFGPVRDLPPAERDLFALQAVCSIVIMPIVVEENFWGFIRFDDCANERLWSEAELDAMRVAADIFGAALTRGNVEKKLLRRQRSLDLMQKIIRAALEKNELEEMCQYLVDHIGILIRADHCFLNLWDENKQRIIPQAAYGELRESYKNITIHPGEKTFTASALEIGATLIEENVNETPYCSPRITAQFSTTSMLVMPMIVNQVKLGAVLLGFKEPHHFTGDEIAISEQATALVAIALSKLQAMQNAHRRAEESETLRRAGVVISETLNLQDATSRLLEQLAFVVPHDSATVQLLRQDELEIINCEGWEFPSQIIGLRFPIPGNNPNTAVIQTGKPRLLDHADQAYPTFREPPHDHIRSWLGVPLIVRNKIIGLLAIDSRDPSHFSNDDIEVVSAFAGQVSIAIENARLFDEVQRLAITDSLTGLNNRRHFMEIAQIEFDRARRYKRQLSALIFDIDHFKKVNDNYGHQVGDQVLAAIAKLCTEKLREADPIGRYGGEEFIALIVEADPQTTLKVGERLRHDVEQLGFYAEQDEIKVTVSIGIAGMNEHTPDLKTLINRADQALYVAKHKGRNRVVMGT